MPIDLAIAKLDVKLLTTKMDLTVIPFTIAVNNHW